jgi:hypothetical protein
VRAAQEEHGTTENDIEAYIRIDAPIEGGKVFKDRLPGQQLADELSVIVDELRNDPSMAADTAA